MNIYGKEVPFSLLLAYASVRNTSGAVRSKLHTEILECVTNSPEEHLEYREGRNPWVRKFEVWVEMFVYRMASRFPHAWQKTETPKDIYGIPVDPKLPTWKCSFCGDTLIRAGKPPVNIPCWKAVAAFYEPYLSCSEHHFTNGRCPYCGMHEQYYNEIVQVSHKKNRPELLERFKCEAHSHSQEIIKPNHAPHG
jgi:hypothetical protein